MGGVFDLLVAQGKHKSSNGICVMYETPLSLVPLSHAGWAGNWSYS